MISISSTETDLFRVWTYSGSDLELSKLLASAPRVSYFDPSWVGLFRPGDRPIKALVRTIEGS
jgi:hypothetical protein